MNDIIVDFLKRFASLPPEGAYPATTPFLLPSLLEDTTSTESEDEGSPMTPSTADCSDPNAVQRTEKPWVFHTAWKNGSISREDDNADYFTSVWDRLLPRTH